MGKKKKEKIRYYDDGSTVSDMSALSPKKKTPPHTGGNTAKDRATTFFGAMKMMLVPMITVICGLCIVYMLVYLLFFFLG